MIARSRSEIIIFLLLFFSASYFRHPVEYDNTLSRYLLLSSVVDYGRLDIGRYAGDTVDVSLHDGRTFSNKAIGAPLLALPFYEALRRWTPIRRDPPLSSRAIYLIRLWASSLPFALMGLVWYRLLLAMGVSALDAYLAVLAYAFGTLAWLHASLFSGHQTAASLAFCSFAVLWRLGPRQGSSGWPWLGAGLLAGLAALSDYLCGWIALALAVYAWRRGRSWQMRAAFLLGLGLCLFLLAAYDTACFGLPWRLSYALMGPGFGENWRQGFLGVALPRPANLLRLLFSPSRGLFFIMPVLLMALPGFAALHRRGEGRRDEFWLLAVAVCGVLLANAGFYAWHGGWSFGPRYMVCALPFLAFPMAFALDRRWLIPLGTLSLLQNLAAQAVMPHTPSYIENPIVECLLPLLHYGYWAENLGAARFLPGAWSLAPGLAVMLGLAWLGRPAARDSGAAVSRGWRVLYGAFCAGVPAALLCVRSPAPAAVHRYNAKLLEDAAQAAFSPTLARGAAEERRLSSVSGPRARIF
jgi:hypothetical protein